MTEMDDFCITKVVARGRPTWDPKGALVAVRLNKHQHHVLTQRARREGITLSEAMRRCVEAWAATQPPRVVRPTKAEKEMFDQLFEAVGARRRPRSRK
jgi:hypothetical protein